MNYRLLLVRLLFLMSLVAQHLLAEDDACDKDVSHQSEFWFWQHVKVLENEEYQYNYFFDLADKSVQGTNRYNIYRAPKGSLFKATEIIFEAREFHDSKGRMNLELCIPERDCLTFLAGSYLSLSTVSEEALSSGTSGFFNGSLLLPPVLMVPGRRTGSSAQPVYGLDFDWLRFPWGEQKVTVSSGLYGTQMIVVESEGQNYYLYRHADYPLFSTLLSKKGSGCCD